MVCGAAPAARPCGAGGERGADFPRRLSFVASAAGGASAGHSKRSSCRRAGAHPVGYDIADGGSVLRQASPMSVQPLPIVAWLSPVRIDNEVELSYGFVVMIFRDQLIAELKAKRCTVVVGAGVSAATTRNSRFATWTGLLQSGVEYVEQRHPGQTDWSTSIRRLLESTDIDDLLGLASRFGKNSCGLGTANIQDGSGRRWVSPSGDTGHDCQVSRAQSQLATTNYDELIEQCTGVKPATWRSPTILARTIRGQEESIIHLHGLWSDPDSVVLDLAAYERVWTTSSFRRRSALSCSLARCCSWAAGRPGRSQLPDATHVDGAGLLEIGDQTLFRLALDSDVERLARKHLCDGIVVLPYGKDYSDLPRYLDALARDAFGHSAPKAANDVRAVTARGHSIAQADWLTGHWTGGWLWNDRPRVAVIDIERGKTGLMTVTYERRGEVTKVELSLDIEMSQEGDSCVFRVSNANFLEQGTARRWLPETYELRCERDRDELVGVKYETRGPSRKTDVRFLRALWRDLGFLIAARRPASWHEFRASARTALPPPSCLDYESMSLGWGGARGASLVDATCGSKFLRIGSWCRPFFADKVTA